MLNNPIIFTIIGLGLLLLGAGIGIFIARPQIKKEWHGRAIGSILNRFSPGDELELISVIKIPRQDGLGKDRFVVIRIRGKEHFFRALHFNLFELDKLTEGKHILHVTKDSGQIFDQFRLEPVKDAGYQRTLARDSA